MTVEKFIENIVTQALEKLFDLDKLKFDEIVILQDVVESIILLAKENYPKEFLAFLDGKIKDKKLVIDGLLYQEYSSTLNSAAPIFHFPDKTFYGSVHSHPGPSNRPSGADREFFRKIGIINMIISRPFRQEDIRFYNHDGEEIAVRIE
jgi:proteasome lid subunit RPN8/RPN11